MSGNACIGIRAIDRGDMNGVTPMAGITTCDGVAVVHAAVEQQAYRKRGTSR